MELPLFVRRTASGDEGAAPALANIGLKRQMEFNGGRASLGSERENPERGTREFEVAGGNFRMIVAFDFGREIVFVKFIGTHAEYDRIDALTVALF